MAVGGGGALRQHPWLEGSQALLAAGQAVGRPQLVVHSVMRWVGQGGGPGRGGRRKGGWA